MEDNNAKNNLIKEIITMEFAMFDKVNGLDGRAPCQNDLKSFFAMRYSQHNAFSEATLNSYMKDLWQAQGENRNLITEKYAYMMEFTDHLYYQDILKNTLPIQSVEKLNLIEEILAYLEEDFRQFSIKYPLFAKMGRPQATDAPVVTVRTYNMGELKTYSYETLTQYKKDLINAKNGHISIVEKIQNQTAIFYGYKDINEAERSLKARLEKA